MASFANRLMSGRSKMAVAAAACGGSLAVLYAQREQLYARNWHSNAHLKYPASANFPDLSRHYNAIAKFLTPGVSGDSSCTPRIRW